MQLEAHPAAPPAGIRGVAVDWRRDGATLHLDYRASGTDALLLPPPAPSARADGLWQTTCFELFLALEGTAYAEFNFSPSTAWAAYLFDGYRRGMRDLDIAPPAVARRGDGVTVTLDLGDLARRATRAGVAAVVEEEGGVKSFWALVHPAERPDFHHPACFAGELPAATRA